MTPEQIFTTYARHIGIGGIATAGIIGIIKSWGIIRSCSRTGCQRALKAKATKTTESQLRTSQRHSNEGHLLRIGSCLHRHVPLFHVRRG